MDIKTQLDAIVDRYNLLEHPFYQAWSAGTLPVEALKTYAEEYGAFVATIPRGWAAHGDDATAEEEREHCVLWAQFADGLGTHVGEPRVAQIKTLVAEADALFCDPAEAMGALYAFEAQQPNTSRSKLEGLQAHYQQLPKSVEPYFEVHVDDVHEMAWLIERLEARPEADQAKAAVACKRLAKALYDGLTGIYDAHCPTNVN